MTGKRSWWLAAAVGLALVAVLFVVFQGRHAGLPPPTGNSGQSNNATHTAGAPAADGELDSRLRTLVSSPSGETLAAARTALLAADPRAASAAIRKFLDSKANAPTGQAFKVAAGGHLDSAPTLRVAMLDLLAQVDPAAAAAYARQILASPDSPDEWAVALRNLAQGDSLAEARAFLEQKTGELLRNASWQQDPSVGYLEAFDTAVFLGGTNLVTALGDLLRKQDNQAVAQAAYLSLDRLIINEPAPLLSLLENDPALMQGRERTRANYFARADVSDPRQRQILEQYLLDPRIGTGELATFASLYPSANFMISQNLLTSTPTPDHDTLARHDAAALEVVNQWLVDPRFAAVQAQLQTAKRRLEEFTRQAGPH